MLYGLPRRVVEERGKALFERMDLPGLWTRMPRSMSGGQKRRLDIVMGLIHEPQLMFLDEPTTGLDPQARANLWAHIRDLRDRLGVTVFLTTHYMDEADALADRIVIIDHGRIVASDTADNLKAQVAGDLVDLEVADRRPGRPTPPRSSPTLVGGRSAVEVDDLHVRARVPRAGRSVQGLLRDLDGAGHRPADLEIRRPTLDDVFLALTGRSLRDAESGRRRDRRTGRRPGGAPRRARRRRRTATGTPPRPAAATGTPSAGPASSEGALR